MQKPESFTRFTETVLKMLLPLPAGGNFVLTEAITLSEGKFIKLAKAADGKFYEVARG